MKTETVVTLHGSVWMTDNQTSAARALAVDAMRALGMNEGDWRTRDTIIMGINDRINRMLDQVRNEKIEQLQKSIRDGEHLVVELIEEIERLHKVIRTDADKIAKTIALLKRLEVECMIPAYAHDARSSCPICRLLKELQ